MKNTITHQWGIYKVLKKWKGILVQNQKNWKEHEWLTNYFNTILKSLDKKTLKEMSKNKNLAWMIILYIHQSQSIKIENEEYEWPITF